MYGTCWHMLLVHVVIGCLVQVYSSICHSDSVTVVPSFYFFVRVVGQGKDGWL